MATHAQQNCTKFAPYHKRDVASHAIERGKIMPDAIPHDTVAAAINLTPHIRAVREELEATRRLPPSLVQAIADAGLFRLYLPHAVGGPELPPLTVFRVIEELSKADGSVGWCTMIATAVSVFAGWLPTEVGSALCGQLPDLRVAGS